EITRMHDLPRQKLCELINHHGTILTEEAERCESLLHKTSGDEYKREIFVLVNAIKEGVVKELLNAPPGLLQEAVFDRLAQQLHDNLWLDKAAAEWAVQSWGMALGMTITTSTFEKSTQPLPDQSITSFQSSTAKKTKPPKQLSPFNPFNYLRLLWWILVKPQQLSVYRKAFGETDEKRIANWLVSTLIWFPLLVPILALGLKKVPYSTNAWLPKTYLLFSIFLIIGWLLTGWLRTNKNVAVGVAISIAISIAIGVAIGGVGIVAGVGMDGVAIGVAIICAVLVAAVVAVAIEIDIAVVVAGVVVIGVAVGVAVGIALDMADFVVAFVAGGIVGFVIGFVVDAVTNVVGNTTERSLKTGTPSTLARLAFLLLIIAHSFLIGLPFILNSEFWILDLKGLIL
ncbi:hypothetical protein, partial [Candidatus Parabeggiatoa sp. HSG14]|uniref:hypothetical protein n=1 Tax=Candidatus Parabeggiatoa sp. HSG14 TaxID=3055593 RepID=UPI0025A71F78|nr:hypothetical protein [Thiotrichales bacterium HSG14]